MKTNKKAEAGIGTLILFIALILVAAVAAGVLIQTSGSLQSKALATGSQAQTQVSSGLIILQAWGENASGSQTIDRMYFKAKLAPGSDPIVLNASYVSFATQAVRQTYRFNLTGNTQGGCDNETEVIENTAGFIATGLVGYGTEGYLLDGDIVNICFATPAVVPQSTQITVAFAPKVGSIASFTTTTPDVMTDAKVPLFPN